MSREWLAWLAPVFTWLRDLPSYVVAPVFTFFGVVATLFFSPRVQWTIEKKRELRQHQRQLIAQWRAMVSDVSKELERLEQAGTRCNLDDVLRILERHVDYASFKSTYDHYSESGIRGVRIRFARSWVRRKFPLWRPKFQAHPERTVVYGSHLPARLHLTIRQIAEIERWWKLHK
jgi:hypothetical protein